MTSSKDIDQQLDREYAEAWRPAPGEKLIGRVVEIGMRNGEFGGYPILTVKRDDGVELALHAFHTVATNELAAAKPQVGEQIAILYRGPLKSADGKSSYHGYKVVMPERPAPTFSWAAFGEPEPEPEPDVPIGPVEPGGPPPCEVLETREGDDDIPW